MKPPSVDADQLASAARVLEELLPHGYSLIHNRHRWWIKRFNSWVHRDGDARMGWQDVDDDESLSVLLARLREGPREQP